MSALERYGPWALVTGASDGIGRALARRIAADGLNVLLVARREQALRALAEEIERAHGVLTEVLAVDLADPTGLAALAQKTGRFDIGLAVLAAGFGAATPFVETPVTDELAMIAVNVSAVAHLCNVLGSAMAARGSGGLVLFGSILGWQGVAGQAGYAATKAYVQTLAEGLRLELVPSGVHVLAVAPGPVETGFATRAGLSMRLATSPDVVANAVVGGLGRGVTVVPGLRAKLLTAALATMPRRLRSVVLSRAVAGMRAGQAAQERDG